MGDAIIIKPVLGKNGIPIKTSISIGGHFLFEIQFPNEKKIEQLFLNTYDRLTDEEFIESVQKMTSLKDLTPKEIKLKELEKIRNLLT